jgi:hypothetical protein
MVVFLSGVLARIFSADIYGKQIGNVLMTIAGLSGLLLYVRGLRYLSFVPPNENSAPLGLSGAEQTPLAANSRQKSTPLERIIADD